MVFFSAYDDGSDFDASELVDDSDDQSDDDGSSLTGNIYCACIFYAHWHP